MHGQGGSDWLYGGPSDDQVTGGTASDRLDGGTGFDIARGGIGFDVCIDAEDRRSCERAVSSDAPPPSGCLAAAQMTAACLGAPQQD